MTKQTHNIAYQHRGRRLDDAPISSDPRSGERVRVLSRRIHVLLAADPEPPKPSIVSTFGQACFEVQSATTLLELRQQAVQHQASPYDVVFLDLELSGVEAEHPARFVQTVQDAFPLATVVAMGGSLTGEEEAHLLSFGVASLQKPVSLAALAILAMKLSPTTTSWQEPWPQTPNGTVGRPLEYVVDSYCSNRALSGQQMRILNFHLKGQSDKEIAHSCGCRLTTIYEHWRRMAKKVGGVHKQDVIADFHRFIGAA